MSRETVERGAALYRKYYNSTSINTEMNPVDRLNHAQEIGLSDEGYALCEEELRCLSDFFLDGIKDRR